LGHLRAAVARIAKLTRIERVSRVYETSPVGGPPQDDFLNAAVLVATSLDPLVLLDGLQIIERDLGRMRDVRWGPRTIDLDILWGKGLVVDTARLVVPHPRLAQRSFALAPLLEIVPDAIDPRTKQRYTLLSDEVGIRPRVDLSLEIDTTA
jgi:2-amino-4-hydroxy-6-hydroxymethyldihydropteridine diphosphokinase